ncbi:hypothetical protein [Vibrio gallicus]|uniref:hypothetical protein n=1 Tax=Vibrio gallicus TaxID=190897 RepID=UPI0021C4C715|nr:hypothetical protein [Vibrio gallicus]
MAAEKLTKGRLIQILITFIVLLAAFFWRSATHNECVTDDNSNASVHGQCEVFSDEGKS